MTKPAFPVHTSTTKQYEGMTMRQWYKGMALANIPNHMIAADIAQHAGSIADALLKEDKKHEM